MLTPDYSFGNWVKRRRKALDLTQQELAQRVGCSLSLIFKIESDERRPSRQIAELLARHLEVPIDQIPIFLKIARQKQAVDTLREIHSTDQQSLRPTINIPLVPGPILGREFELAEITRLIQDSHCRLLTLTGQGGVGKTCLAIHAAASIVDSTNKQIVFVSLAPISGREQAVTAIADALGIVLYTASDRATQLITYLQDKELFLILDNYEHLISDVNSIGLISDILRGSQKIKVITTSREPLSLQAEWIFEVQGLPVPNGNQWDELEANSAVVLFIQRAKQAVFGFEPTREDLSAIAKICELVEGLPLGIELAAPWARSLTCMEIASEIHKSIDFLATSARDIPERHRSIRATIEYSWKLLTAEEQRILRQLSIFRGGFDRQAAEAVARAPLSALMALLSKSLIRRAETNHFNMHELIHQYALNCLQQDDFELDRTRLRYIQYYSNLLDQRGTALKGADRPRVVAELIFDLPNLRQAWSWAASQQQARDLSRSADTLFWLYESRSNCREGVPLFTGAIKGLQIGERVLESQEGWVRQLALGQALSYKGFFLFRQGQHPQGREALRSSLDLLEEIPDRELTEVQMALSNTKVFLGVVTSVLGDFKEGERLLYEGLRIKQTLGDLWGSAFCLRQLGLSSSYRGEYEEAYQALEQSLAISRELENTWSIAASLNQLGTVAYFQGKHAQAWKYLSDGLELSRNLEDRASIADALHGLGLVSVAQGQYEEAQSLLQESIALWNEIGEQGSLAQTLIHYGDALLKMNDIAGARNQYQESLAVASSAQIMPVLLEALLGEVEIRIADGEVESLFAVLEAVCQHESSSHATRSRAKKINLELKSRSSRESTKTISAPTGPKAIEAFIEQVLNTRATAIRSHNLGLMQHES